MPVNKDFGKGGGIHAEHEALVRGIAAVGPVRGVAVAWVGEQGDDVLNVG